MQQLIGTVQFKTFGEGTKSESLRPYLCFENGTQILIYKKDDNPFENNAFAEYEGKSITVQGELVNGVFEVEEIVLEENDNGIL